MLMARQAQLLAASIVAAATFECSSPTVPEVRLSTDVNLSATPGLIEPAILSGPPWRWRAGWTVNLTAPEEVARKGDVIVALRTRIEQQDGHVLAELTEEARRLEPQVGMRSVIQFPETATYETQADPPTTSRLVMTARLFDGHGRSEEVSAAQAVLELLCGRDKPRCTGADIAVSGAGVDPASVTIRFGQHVTFYSRDGAAHKISSNPHPAHTGCPSLNVVEFGAGINGSTSPFLTPGTCRYHDDNFLGHVRGEVIVLPIGQN
jgi:plastocyanin